MRQSIMKALIRTKNISGRNHGLEGYLHIDESKQKARRLHEHAAFCDSSRNGMDPSN